MTHRKWNKIQRKDFDSLLSERGVFRDKMSPDYSSINQNSKNNSKIKTPGLQSWKREKTEISNENEDMKETRFASLKSQNRTKNISTTKSTRAEKKESQAYKVLFTNTTALDFNKKNNTHITEKTEEDDQDDIKFTSRKIEIKEVNLKTVSENKKENEDSSDIINIEALSGFTTGGSKNFERPHYRKKYTIPTLNFSRSLSKNRENELKRMTRSE